MKQKISLHVGDVALITGIFEDGALPQDGDKIIATMDAALDTYIEKLVKSTYNPQYEKVMRKTCLEHFKKTGEFPKYFALKVLCSHNLDVHKRNIQFLDKMVTEIGQEQKKIIKIMEKKELIINENLFIHRYSEKITSW